MSYEEVSNNYRISGTAQISLEAIVENAQTSEQLQCDYVGSAEDKPYSGWTDNMAINWRTYVLMSEGEDPYYSYYPESICDGQIPQMFLDENPEYAEVTDYRLLSSYFDEYLESYFREIHTGC